MFVVEALVLTFITTPLTLLVYPASVRTFHSGSKAKKDHEADEKKKGPAPPIRGGAYDTVDKKLRIAVMLHKLEHMSPLMTITQLLGPANRSVSSLSSGTAVGSATISQTSDTPRDDKVTSSESQTPSPTIDALRLMDLSDRTSAVMYGSVTAELLARDPLVSAMRTFARIHRIPVSTAALSVTPQDEFPTKISERAAEVSADLVLVPWNTSLHPVVEPRSPGRHHEHTSGNPFEGLFRTGSTSNLSAERSAAIVYAQFVRKVFSTSSIDVGLFIERDASGEGISAEFGEKPRPVIDGYHIFFPYFGGPDDRLALNFIIQLCGNGNGSVQATIVRMFKTEADTSADASKTASAEQNEAMNMLTTQSVS